MFSILVNTWIMWGIRLENLKQERGAHCYLCKLLRRKGTVDGFVLFSIDFSEAVSGWVLADQERIFPKACFCYLGLFVLVQSSDGYLAKILKFFHRYYTMPNWSVLLLAPREPCWGGIQLSQCQISELMLFLCQCITWAFSIEFSCDWFLLRGCLSRI